MVVLCILNIDFLEEISKNENEPKNGGDLENEDDPKYKDILKILDNQKNEDNPKTKDTWQPVPHP